MTEPLRYESVKLNETIGPFEYQIPSDYNDHRLKSLSITDASFLQSPDGKLFAEPSFLCGQHSWVVRQRYSWGGSVHAKCEVEFCKPVFPGAGISVSAAVADKYERRGGHYVVFELVTLDAQGDVLARVRNTMLLNLREVLEYKKKAAADKRPETTAEAAPKQGETGAGPRLLVTYGPKPISREDIVSFFHVEERIYGPHQCIHNDAGIARAAGLADIIAPGRYLIGMGNGMFGSIFGERWLRSGKYSVSFMGNLLPGVVAGAESAPAAPGGEPAGGKRKAFSLLCQDGATGKRLLSGTVSIEID